ncbi:MAG: hypothetical protein RI924_1351 [Bacteroidota bacterium]|jgi:hypothetical protein
MEQNFKNHRRMVPGYHYVLSFLLLVGLIGSIINLCQSEGTAAYYSASLITLLFVCAFLTTAFTRTFALKAQDRAIRAEENLRHFVLTGKTLPAGLSIHQIVALRFAADAEFPTLAEKAVKEGLSGKAIKQEIKDWKADHYRV